MSHNYRYLLFGIKQLKSLVVKYPYAFTFNVNTLSTTTSLIKRALLSNIIKVYDPCSWLASICFISKLIMLELWKTNFGSVSLPEQHYTPGELAGHPMIIKIILTFLNTLHIPSAPTIPTHYMGSILKVRTAAVSFVCSDTKVTTLSLLTSKTRVASLKQLFIPFVELGGAILLS